MNAGLPELPVPFAVWTALTVVFLSAGVACLCAALSARLFKRKCARHRVVCGLLSLTAAVVCCTAAVLFASVPGAPEDAVFFIFTRFDLRYYGILFAAAFAGALFYRAVGIPLLVLYCAYVLFAGVSLYGFFGHPRSEWAVSLSVREGGQTVYCGVDGRQLPSSVTEDSPCQYVRFLRLSVPDRALLPLPSLWLRPEAFTASEENSAVPSGEDVSGVPVFRVFRLLSGGSESFCSQEFVPLPVREFYPATFLLQNRGNAITAGQIF